MGFDIRAMSVRSGGVSAGDERVEKLAGEIDRRIKAKLAGSGIVGKGRSSSSESLTFSQVCFVPIVRGASCYAPHQRASGVGCAV